MAKTDSIKKKTVYIVDTTCIHVINDALSHLIFDVCRLTSSIYITLLNLFAETRTIMLTFKEYKMFTRTTCVNGFSIIYIIYVFLAKVSALATTSSMGPTM